MLRPATSPLKPEWAFVIQLHEGTSFVADALRGRIEHVVSGRARDFASLEAARGFMQELMGAAPDGGAGAETSGAS